MFIPINCHKYTNYYLYFLYFPHLFLAKNKKRASLSPNNIVPKPYTSRSIVPYSSTKVLCPVLYPESSYTYHPYYLLAKLYASPGYLQPDKFHEMADLVLTKEPKVQSTAVREMRDEIRKLVIDVSNEKIVNSRNVND